MAIKIVPSQYKLLSRYCENLSSAIALATLVGFFLPSVLPSAIVPTKQMAIAGTIWALILLVLAVILVRKGENNG